MHGHVTIQSYFWYAAFKRLNRPFFKPFDAFQNFFIEAKSVTFTALFTVVLNLQEYVKKIMKIWDLEPANRLPRGI